MMTIGLYGIQNTASTGSPINMHDHGMAAMRDRRVVTVVGVEHHTGVKHDNRLAQFLPGLLNEIVPAHEEVTFVSCNPFVGDSYITHDGNLRIEPERRPSISSELVPARRLWYPSGVRPCRLLGYGSLAAQRRFAVGDPLPYVRHSPFSGA
jgi:hypothetical protein